MFPVLPSCGNAIFTNHIKPWTMSHVIISHIIHINHIYHIISYHVSWIISSYQFIIYNHIISNHIIYHESYHTVIRSKSIKASHIITSFRIIHFIFIWFISSFKSFISNHTISYHVRVTIEYHWLSLSLDYRSNHISALGEQVPDNNFREDAADAISDWRCRRVVLYVEYVSNSSLCYV